LNFNNTHDLPTSLPPPSIKISMTSSAALSFSRLFLLFGVAFVAIAKVGFEQHGGERVAHSEFVIMERYFTLTNLKRAAAGLAVCTLICYASTSSIVSSSLAKLDGLPLWQSSVLFVGLCAISTVAWLPTSPINLFAGVRFGVLHGSFVTLVGLQLGASVAFLLGRSVLRRYLQSQVDASPGLRTLMSVVSGRRGPTLILLSRLAPVFPFSLLNYAYGITNVEFWTYNAATFVGLAPSIVLVRLVPVFA
jgi:uncharacterized membrane protein YdjX (TVP38/TMEM64 family)